MRGHKIPTRSALTRNGKVGGCKSGKPCWSLDRLDLRVLAGRPEGYREAWQHFTFKGRPIILANIPKDSLVESLKLGIRVPLMWSCG